LIITFCVIQHIYYITIALCLKIDVSRISKATISITYVAVSAVADATGDIEIQ